MLAAVGKEAVDQAKGLAIAHFVAVAFVPVLVVEGLGVGELDVCALAAGDGEERIGGGEGLAVEKDMDVAAGGDGDRGGWKAVESGNAGADGFAGAGGLGLHVRKPVRDEAPGIVGFDVG